ncbi:carbohydrate ABC transporter permease [Paenibacillus athensensis]|uniref:ABC transporter permease n=1 Tax=Paenibacillus athensensis TaxID=1967502 RepID=A0A4Y8Q8N2_9BACL|nr:carbohydrate ABC transporter permease [Paenibacillus athensensis]MCD1260067.1 carbohydrate ABC transporter permease [Paenibacillus athensensis]
MKLSASDKFFMTIIYALLCVLVIITFYPFWNSLVISLNTGSDTALGGVTIWPRDFTLDNYKVVFKEHNITNAFLITVARTVLGTFLSIFFTAMFAYGLSKRGIVFKKFYMIVCVITMYFSGGLIPYFILIHSMHLYNTFTFLVIHGLINVFNMIIFRTFFMEIPQGLEESAKIDGCSNFGVYFRIVLPMSKPVLATLSLFTAVTIWNDWFIPAVFLVNEKLLPLQTLLVQVINQSVTSQLVSNLNSYAQTLIQQTTSVKSLQMATMMVASLPILLVYPFIQKYFVKGVMVGSLKE